MFRFHRGMPFDHVVTMVNSFNGFDLSMLGVYICLNIWVHEFESLIENWTTVNHGFVWKGINPLIRVLQNFDCSLGLVGQQSHHLGSKNSRLPMFHEFLFSDLSKARSSDFYTCHSQFFDLFTSGNCQVASAPHLICVFGNELITYLVPSLDHMDVVFGGNGVCIGSFDIAVRQNVEQGSISKLSSILFGSLQKRRHCFQGWYRSKFQGKSLVWLLCRGKCIPLNWQPGSCCKGLLKWKPFLKLRMWNSEGIKLELWVINWTFAANVWWDS